MTLSRNELYALVALVSSGAIALFYLITVVGLPGDMDPIAENLRGPLVRTIGLAFLVELLLGLVSNGRVERDERDHLIAGKGYRNAYLFAMVVIMSLLGHVAIRGVLAGSPVSLSGLVMFHTLAMTLLLSSVVNQGSRLYFYWRGA